MNKQELIERLEGLKNIFGNECEYVKIDFVIELTSELDEPQKVKVPQFVADVIEGVREESSELETAFQYAWWSDSDEFTEWYGKKSNRDVFARAWLDGYEVEKEKRYTIRFKNIRKETRYLKYDRVVENWYFGVEQCSKETKISHTRTELEEAGFGWVFDCEGIEIEEVD